MTFQNAFCYGKSESGAFGVMDPPVKRLKDMGDVFFAYSWTIVGHFQRCAIFFTKN